jgi:hypothetical protein
VAATTAPTPLAATTAPVGPAGETSALRPGFVHGKRSAFQGLAVKPLDGALHVFFLGKLHEAKPSGFPRHLVANNRSGNNLKASVGHEFAEHAIRYTSGKVPHKQPLTHLLLHFPTTCLTDILGSGAGRFKPANRANAADHILEEPSRSDRVCIISDSLEFAFRLRMKDNTFLAGKLSQKLV